MAYIKWIKNRPFVYSAKGKYFGRYLDYRLAHPYGVYLDICTTSAKLKLTRKRVQYLMDIDTMATAWVT